MSNTENTVATEILATTVIGTIVLQHVVLRHNTVWGPGSPSYYYLAVNTSGGSHSGFCADANEALARTLALETCGGRHATCGITQAPNGICNETEMARAVAKFDGGMKLRDGGVCEAVVRAAVAAGLLSPEWVIASAYVASNGLYR